MTALEEDKMVIKSSGDGCTLMEGGEEEEAMDITNNHHEVGILVPPPG